MAWETRGPDVEERITRMLAAWADGAVDPGAVLAAAPDPVLRRRLGRGRQAGGQARPALPAAGGGPELKELYEEDAGRTGREPGFTLLAPPGPANVFCAEDPDRSGSAYGQHLLADAGVRRVAGGRHASYVRDDSRTVEEMRAAGVYVVLTADDLVDRCRSGEIRLVTSHPACGGLPAEPSWETLRLICETVLPAVRCPIRLDRARDGSRSADESTR